MQRSSYTYSNRTPHPNGTNANRKKSNQVVEESFELIRFTLSVIFNKCLLFSVTSAGYKITRYPPEVARYQMIKHKSEMKNPINRLVSLLLMQNSLVKIIVAFQ